MGKMKKIFIIFLEMIQLKSQSCLKLQLKVFMKLNVY